MKTATLILTGCVLAFAGTATAATAADTAALEARLAALETQLTANLESEAQKHNAMQLSGYADIEYVHTTANNSDPHFRIHHMALMPKKIINDRLKFFSEIEFEDAPLFAFDNSGSCMDQCAGQLFVEAVNIDYIASPAVILRMGRFYTPSGIWSINHYSPYVPTQERPTGVHQLYPHVVDGIDVIGTAGAGNNFVNYHVYVGNNTADSISRYGLRLALTLPDWSALEIGLNAYHDTWDDETDQTTLGGHLLFRHGSLHFQAEYGDANLEPAAGSSYTRQGYYTQLIYSLNDHWGVGVRHDYYNTDDPAPAAGDVAGRTTNSLFLNYHIDKDTVLKLESHMVDDKVVSNYQKTIASIAINLGN